MASTLFKAARVVNEGAEFESDVRVEDRRIIEIAPSITARAKECIVEAQGGYLMPGMIDDQVHFREPGLTHKGTIFTESRAAVAGGITSFMEMPNVTPATTTLAALQDKFALAAERSIANYSFYLGATEDNLDQIKQLDAARHCGVKIFMGASTGDLLVEDPVALEAIFRESPVLIVTHCESGAVISQNKEKILRHKDVLGIEDHPKIRDAAACFASSELAVGLARRHGSHLHVLHITTARELSLFSSGPVGNKTITAEACVHHLWFSADDYANLGNLIKCNPAIKSPHDRDALLHALHAGQIDIIATDHAPHTLAEKQCAYAEAPAGLPLVQHALPSLMDHVHHGRMSLPMLVEKTAHNPATRYAIDRRGFIREGYYADLVLMAPNRPYTVADDNILYKCAWSPFTGHTFQASVMGTWVNGSQVYDGHKIAQTPAPAMPLLFNR